MQPETLAAQFQSRVLAKLDFTPDSLTRLAKESQTLAKDDGEVLGEAACYYGEVLRRGLGGEWGTPHAPFVSQSENGLIQVGGHDTLAVLLEGGIAVDVFETAERFLGGQPEAFANEYEEMSFATERGDEEVFDDADYHGNLRDEAGADPLAPYIRTGLVLRWLAERSHLVPRWQKQYAEQKGRPAEVFQALGGRLTSHALMPEADRFLRAYWLGDGSALGSTLWDTFEAGMVDDDATYARLAATLDGKFEAWLAKGRPAG